MKNTTYRNLIDQFFKWIWQNVHNIDAYSIHVPEQALPGFTMNVGVGRGGYTATIDANTVLPVVTQADINAEFNDFCLSRGIAIKEDMTVTTRGMINFWNNAAAFCSQKLVIIAGQFFEATILMYKPGYASYDMIESVDNDHDAISTIDVDNMLGVLSNTINKISKLHMITYTVTAYCSCCSCSSSSSSSSSMFVAHMKI